VKIAKNHPDFSGTGFADFINTIDDYIQWSFNKASAGVTTLQIRYSNGRDLDRPLRLEVNGRETLNISFPSTRSWTNWSVAQAVVNLKAGVNTVRVTAIGSSGPNVDYLAYSSSNNQVAQRSAGKNDFDKSADLLKVSVSPNPAQGNAKLILTSASSHPIEMELLDMLGKTYQKMKFMNTTSNTYNFSVADLPPGIYLIKVKQGTVLKTTRLLVNNKTLR